MKWWKVGDRIIDLHGERVVVKVLYGGIFGVSFPLGHPQAHLVDYRTHKEMKPVKNTA